MLEFQNVSFSYPNAPCILNACNICINENEIVFIVGVNGAGKSTFLKLAAGLISPQSGAIKYHSNETRIGYHQQYVHIAESVSLSVEELVGMGRVGAKKLFFNSNDKKIVQQSLEQVQLESLAKKSIHTISRGQYQRVLLARLLASEPSIIIMDEPEEFLDAISRDTLSSLIRTLSAKITFLISSHNFDFIFSLADRVICITNPYQNQEDHKFFQFLEKQNKTIKVEHLCFADEGK